jgi:DNA helicase-2/ATP-dependent DNA helicase PcrA
VGITRARVRLYVLCAAQRMLYGQTTHNLPSRFIEEMGLTGQPKPQIQPRVSADYVPSLSRPKSLTVNRSLLIEKGDAITHKSFGKGVVLTVSPMGSDAMLEIAFEENGTKKLMRNYAAKFISKEI